MEKVILCVDDEKIVTDTLITQLRSEFGDDYYYESAGDVFEAWDIIDELIEDDMELKLIISDWLMPRQKGDEFLMDVHKKWPTIKLVMLSGQADEDAIKKLEQLVESFQFIRKPWVKADFMKLIRETLDN